MALGPPRPGAHPRISSRERALALGVGALLALASLFLGVPEAAAQRVAEGEERALDASLQDLQRRVAGQLLNRAYALVDELVYRWTQAPPFGERRDAFLASVTGPLGLGSAFSARVENHLSGLLLQNEAAQLRLVHCPACTGLIVHARPAQTLVSRGADSLEGLKALGGPEGGLALYLDLSAEGSQLVLRARLVSLEEGLPIRWSAAISEASLGASLLRSGRPLQSAEEARRDYLDALRGEGPLQVPVRFVIRNYESPESFGIAPPPLLWLQLGVESALSAARVWIASAVVGFSWLPEAYDGVMLQARASRLLTGRARSLVRPDLYLFFGGALLRLDGPAIAPFSEQNSVAVRRQIEGDISSSATFGTLQLGLDLRLGQRVGIAGFLEHMPAYIDSETVGEFLDLGPFAFHSFGVEISFCF